MITRSVAQLLEEHVTLDVEEIDRLYLNAYQPRLQTGAGVAAFWATEARVSHPRP